MVQNLYFVNGEVGTGRPKLGHATLYFHKRSGTVENLSTPYPIRHTPPCPSYRTNQFSVIDFGLLY